MAFYDRLKEARVNAELTQEQLADKLGVAKSTLSGYESGNREPTVATIAKALKILNIDANFLYQDEMDALGGNPVKLKYNEMKHIEKYRDLDSHGKEMVDFVLETEHKRWKAEQENSNIIPMAAHNDFTNEEGQQELMQQDLDEL